MSFRKPVENSHAINSISGSLGISVLVQTGENRYKHICDCPDTPEGAELFSAM